MNVDDDQQLVQANNKENKKNLHKTDLLLGESTGHWWIPPTKG